MIKNNLQKITGLIALTSVLYVAGVFSVVATYFEEHPGEGYACGEYGFQVGYGYGYDCTEVTLGGGGGAGAGNHGNNNAGDDNAGDDNAGDDNTADDNTADDNTAGDNNGTDGAGDDNGNDDNGEYEGDQEVVDAYDFGYEHGLTTQKLDEARLYDGLTRSELAKMMSAYIKNVDKKEAVDNPMCDITKYADYATFDDEMKMYIKMACDYGIMGWMNDKSDIIDAFRPLDPVTRAELAAVLSRYLYGDEHAGPDMEEHLKALKEAGIMNDISSPLSIELRGYVLIMLQRIAE